MHTVECKSYTILMNLLQNFPVLTRIVMFGDKLIIYRNIQRIRATCENCICFLNSDFILKPQIYFSHGAPIPFNSNKILSSSPQSW